MTVCEQFDQLNIPTFKFLQEVCPRTPLLTSPIGLTHPESAKDSLKILNMAGTEAALVLGFISGAIAVIDAAKKVYDAAHDAKGLPHQFKEVATRLPLVLDILRKAEVQLKNNKVSESTCKAVKGVTKQCKLNTEILLELFKKVLPKEDVSFGERYKLAFKTLGKGSRVEDLMNSILGDVQLLAENRSMGAATEEQFEQLLVAIDVIKALDSSLDNEPGSISQTHSGSGNNIAASGSAHQSVHTGSGEMKSFNSAGGSINASTSNYNAAVNNYHGSKQWDDQREERG